MSNFHEQLCVCLCVRARVYVRVFGIPVSQYTVAKYIYSFSATFGYFRYKNTSSCHQLMSLIFCFSLFGWKYGFKTTKSKKNDHLLSLMEENVYLTDAEIFFPLRRHLNDRISAPVLRIGGKKEKKKNSRLCRYHFFRQHMLRSVPDLSLCDQTDCWRKDSMLCYQLPGLLIIVQRRPLVD